MPTDNNALPQLLELKLRVKACEEEEGQKEVRADLRIYCSEIDGPDDCVISVRLNRATLDLNLIGLDTVANSRLGEPVRNQKLVAKQTNTIRTTVDGKVAAHAGVDLAKLNPASLKLSADASAEAKVTSLQTSKQEIAEYTVKARGGDTWEVREPPTKGQGSEHPSLDGTYLLDDTLCRASPQRGANMMSVGLLAYAKQRDLKLELIKGHLWHTFMSAGQEKLFKILVAKSLGQMGSKYAGIVKLSHSEIDVED
ncbi:hypothetical protein JQ616_12535 [Bradyrhizobium tropiciagri]|uniref:hypothetical protein n=1 Tax=Bradyrhizobium tropiciagri TaxID=312253 RepID=UPI001BA8C88D|nr:hypothetical protein [Bradyrhizobium tropiciagri]MBR0895782.1 hypothetical protein [Bradyrhizobium tropiciagri]